MMHDFTERAARAVDRYGFLLNILRSQADTVFRRGPTQGALREEAVSVGLGAARSYVEREHDQIDEDSAEVAKSAYERALSDLGLTTAPIEDRFAEFVLAAALYVSRTLASQAERDVMSMAQHIQTTAQRIDLYVRSGRHTPSSAAAAVMIEDSQSPAFRFVDRAGRRFKSTKHIRDIYRSHLLNIYNEVYLDVVATYGHTTALIQHPDPAYKWKDTRIAIVSGVGDFPLYYDLRDEVFHPSSEATVTIGNPRS